MNGYVRSPIRPVPPIERPAAAATTLTEANARVEALWEVVDSLGDLLEKSRAHNEELREQVKELLERGGKSSRNSSKPPSTDSPAQRSKRRSRGRSSRGKGAQPGHPRHERTAVPESEVDERRRYFPEASCPCGSPIAIEAQPACRHQVFDLPEVTHTVVEHQLFGGQCHGCGKRHVAEVPDTVPSGQMGPGLVAWIALMAGEHHLSVRQIQRLLVEQWQLTFSVGAISEAQGLAARALGRPYAAIAEHVRGAEVAHADETRHPKGGVREHMLTGWMWVLTTGVVSFFGVSFSRGKAAAAALLGEFGGVLVTDDLGSYSVVPEGRRQLCWAHLIRHFSAIAERVGRGGVIGKRLLLIGHAVIRTRHRLDREQIDEVRYRRRMDRLRRSLSRTLERGARLRVDGRTKRQCLHLLGREPMLWTFLGDRRIELTNNVAERALRPYVMGRSLCTTSSSV